MEFVDTNILIYAHDERGGGKRPKAAALLARLTEAGSGAMSIQVLTEFYAVSRKLGLPGIQAEAIIRDFQVWSIHRPDVSDLIRSTGLQRRFEISWWDALIVNSATELGCEILWSEDLSHNQQYGEVTVRNPFV